MVTDQLDVLTAQEAFRLLSISDNLGYRLLSEGKLPGIKLSRRKWIIPKARFEAWLNGQNGSDNH